MKMSEVAKNFYIPMNLSAIMTGNTYVFSQHISVLLVFDEVCIALVEGHSMYFSEK